ncbi:MAG: GerMN domain-containing protein [Geodermatophilaceae bacterium]|nr:GerMN domain-containing protein [Geodermatophilaceae bacterium]MDQ3476447.1 LpqB family beta-propeller domain-containing protein [Actinomycetota bacterium]
MTGRSQSMRLGVWAAILGLVISGCSTVPTASAPVAITQVSGGVDEPIGVEPLSPEPGASPEEIVRGFIESSASTVQGRPVSREYLVAAQAETWDDTASITVIEPELSAVTSGPENAVRVTGQLVGTVDRAGIFTPEIDEFAIEIPVVLENDQWRISEPRAGIYITRTDFERAYEQRDIYFLDATSRFVVPDPRFFVRDGRVQSTQLVERLLAGPSLWLSPAVVNELADMRLVSNVLVTGRQARVDLRQDGEPSNEDLEGLSAQLVYTLLGQLSIQSLEITVNGTDPQLPGVGPVQELSDWLSFDSDSGGATGVGHYIDAGGVRTQDGNPIPGPAGTAAYGLTSAAVSIDESTGEPLSLAGLAVSGQSSTLYVGPYGGELAEVLPGSRLTAPTWSPVAEEVWTVLNGSDVFRIPTGAAGQPVPAPELAGTGAVRAFHLSRDGARAALIIETAAGPALFIARVERTQDTVTVRSPVAIAPSLSGVRDVSWTSAGSLIVLAIEPGGDQIVPYTIGVDGWGITELTTDGLPGEPDAVAAAPNRALVSAGGTVWQFTLEVWAVLIRGQAPLPGTAPFYPS